MAQDIFQTFDLDLQRLLVAGSGSASGDDGLFRAKDAFDKLAARVPALAAASAQVSKVLDAKGRAAAGELLSLGVINLKLRAAQAKPAAVEGALSPLPPAAPLDTTTPQHDLESLHRALTSGVTLSGRKIKRLSVINDAIERNVFLDLRLLPLWVQAMADATIGDRVADEIIPKLGEAAAPYLEAQFNPQGKSVDARRLQGLVAIRGEAALPLVERCLQPPPKPAPVKDDEAPAPAGKKGAKKPAAPAKKAAVREVSVEVRAAAVRALEKAAPAQAEARAQALFATEGRGDVRAACVEVMGAGKSAESLGILLEALDDSSQVGDAAQHALRRFGHPQTTDRVLALITPELRALSPYKAPRAKAGQKLTKAEQAAQQKAEQKAMQQRSDRVRQFQRIIDVLSARSSPVVVDTLIDLYRNHPHDNIRSSAGDALKATGDKRAIGVLAERLQEKDGEVYDLGVWAFINLDQATVFDRAKPYFTDEALKTKHGQTLADALLDEVSGEGYILAGYGQDGDDKADEAEAASEQGEEEEVEIGSLRDEERDEARETAHRLSSYPFRRDPRWADLALRLIDRKGLSHSAAVILGHLKDRRGTAPMIELLRKGEEDDAIEVALAAIGDPSAVPAVIGLLKAKKVSDTAYSFLGRSRSPQALDALVARLPDAGNATRAIIIALERIGDPRAAAPISQLLVRKDVYEYPYYALRALRQLDSVEALPGLKAAQAKLARSKNTWRIGQFDDLITYLERAR